ncbi:hypothetical protein [Asticcacaulis sp. YBE204]|uniref:hypothetical protein n=1 Tax=Asticcacaulis sp. YBE204 TaxID=1282363 RepID=UPI0003C3D51C|nr:hypothetical protein [Asticcacaulis sp. YBE204]ESQ78728.1 hypothetical protein AEYBE204_12140 [Asticcacaulis sp. YBE204]
MKQALERITRSIESYLAGTQSKALAAIELVAAFKVACRNAGVDSTALEDPVQVYVTAVLGHIDDQALNRDEAIEELRSLYEKAHLKDPGVVDYMAAYNEKVSRPN